MRWSGLRLGVLVIAFVIDYKHMHYAKSRKSGGFTIVELLIVIVIIGILASLAFGVYGGLQKRARDNIRSQDMANIKRALLAYNTEFGGIQNTATYGGNGGGGWDSSSHANWLAFLSNRYGRMPRDPVNTPYTGQPYYDGQNYFYYCYGGANPRAHYGYFSEQTGSRTTFDLAVENCI